MNWKHTALLIILCFILLVNYANASDYVVGDSCKIGNISFTVVELDAPYVELSSTEHDMTVGSTKLQSLCSQSRLKAIKARRILWVGKH